jgi:hypothetical protein
MSAASSGRWACTQSAKKLHFSCAAGPTLANLGGAGGQHGDGRLPATILMRTKSMTHVKGFGSGDNAAARGNPAFLLVKPRNDGLTGSIFERKLTAQIEDSSYLAGTRVQICRASARAVAISFHAPIT